MKKLAVLVIACFCIVAINGYATKIKTTYYGSEANDALNNPCKGATTRICAIIEEEAVFDTIKKENHVIEIIRDSNGNIISKREYIGTPESRINHPTPISPVRQLNE